MLLTEHEIESSCMHTHCFNGLSLLFHQQNSGLDLVAGVGFHRFKQQCITQANVSFDKCGNNKSNCGGLHKFCFWL